MYALYQQLEKQTTVLQHFKPLYKSLVIVGFVHGQEVPIAYFVDEKGEPCDSGVISEPRKVMLNINHIAQLMIFNNWQFDLNVFKKRVGELGCISFK